jgi:hypothetical protein
MQKYPFLTLKLVQGPDLRFNRQDNLGGLKSSTQKTTTTAMRTENSTVLRIGGFRDQAPLGVLFVPLRPFGPLAPLVPFAGHCDGDPWAAAVVSRLALDPGIFVAPILVADRNASLASSWPPTPTPWTSGSPCVRSNLQRRKR